MRHRVLSLRWLALPIVGAALALVAAAPSGVPDTSYLVPLTFGVAVAASVFGTVVGVIAWRSGQWAPSMLALGCISMAVGGVARFVCADAGLGLSPAATGLMPLIGMLLGGAWFFLCVQAWWPSGNGRRKYAHLTMILGIALAVVSVALLAIVPSLAPAPVVVRTLAGLAAAGYVVAGWRLLSVWRFLRLPSQFTTLCGAFLFAPSVVVLAAGGVPGVRPWQLELFMLAAAAMPVSGFIIEQRLRPGLLTMVHGLFFPGALASMRRGYPAAMVALVERIGAYDGPLLGHVDRVADLSTRIAVDLGFDARAVRQVMLASQLHDIGKLFVPRTILDKPGALDDREWAIVRAHSAKGMALLARTPGLAEAARAVGQHHERWDGGGYPDGIAGEAISPAARIIAGADVFDALSSRRSYKAAWSEEDALQEIERGRGTNFDPHIVDALARLIRSSTKAAA